MTGPDAFQMHREMEKGIGRDGKDEREGESNQTADRAWHKMKPDTLGREQGDKTFEKRKTERIQQNKDMLKSQ